MKLTRTVFLDCNDSERELTTLINNDGELFIEVGDGDYYSKFVTLNKETAQELVNLLNHLVNQMDDNE